MKPKRTRVKPKKRSMYYKAYATDAGGRRRALDTQTITVEVGNGVIVIDLRRPHSDLLHGQLYIGALNEGFLMVGHGDASSVYVSVENDHCARLGHHA